MAGPSSDSQRTLEDAFFADHDKRLRERLSEKAAIRDAKAGLAACSGIADDALLEQLIALEIQPETLTALALVPLVEVAWADGSIAPKEHEAILAAAAENGLRKGGESYAMLDAWLVERPAPELLGAWKQYVRAISGTMSDIAWQAIRCDVMSRATRVAAAAGGFLGLGSKISRSEQEKLDELEAAFDAAE